MKFNKILLTTCALTASLAPSFSLTSCSQKWGHLNPISCGSVDRMKFSDNDPFYDFRNSSTYYDANGRNIAEYLQSNYIIDQDKSTFYSYSSPVTKWYETKEEAQEGQEPKVLAPKDWKRTNDGWTSASDQLSTSVTLDDPEPSKPEGVNIVYTNNENYNLTSNNNITCTVASTISNYFSNALQYQASQINSNDKVEKKDLNTAWGNESKLFDDSQAYTIKTNITDQSNRDFYEFAFASGNSHGTKKSNSFLRPISSNFNYKTFPYPSYSVDNTVGSKIDPRKDVSYETKKLLMGPNALITDKFSDAGIGSYKDRIPAYYTDLKTQTMSIPYVDENNEWQNYSLDVNQYLFSYVPILVEVNNLSFEWVDPTKNDSFIPNDYFINDKQQVVDNIGDSWDKISEFAQGDKTTTIQKFDFSVKQSDPIQFKIYDSSFDPRISSQQNVNGNTFIVLLTYVVNEYDSRKSLEKIRADFEEKGLKRPTQLTEDELKKLNVVSINNVDTIFPAYLLALDDPEMFKKAQKDTDECSFGTIINTATISKYNNKLISLLKRTSEEGMKAHASELTQESKDLLAFLGFMFVIKQSTTSYSLHTSDFIKTKTW